MAGPNARLAQRLRTAVTAGTASEVNEDDLGANLITWGSKHPNKTFQEVYDSDKNYVQWCVGHFGPTATTMQKAFLRYVKQQLDAEFGPEPEEEEGTTGDDEGAVDTAGPGQASSSTDRVARLEGAVTTMTERVQQLEALIHQLAEMHIASMHQATPQ